METNFIVSLEDDTKLKKKSSTCKKMFYRLSIHGVVDFYESHTCFMKLVWALVLLTALLLASTEIYLTFNTYINSPILTTYIVVPRTELQFPQVSVCPMNFVDKNKVKSSSLVNMKTFFGMAQNKKTPILAKINRNLDQIQSISRGPLISSRTRIQQPVTIMKFMENLSIDETDFIKECAFQLKRLDCTTIVQNVFDSDYGQCFIFASNFTQNVSFICQQPL